MYALSRLLLILAVMLFAYCALVMVGLFKPLSYYAVGILAFAALARKGYTRFTTLGSARWADDRDLRKEGMIDG